MATEHLKVQLTKTAKVFHLLTDNQQHSVDEIRAVGGSSGDRRVRELRAEPFNLPIFKERTPGGSWVYRMRPLLPHEHDRALQMVGPLPAVGDDAPPPMEDDALPLPHNRAELKDAVDRILAHEPATTDVVRGPWARVDRPLDEVGEMP